jgi:hypothetical protein
LPQAYSEAVRQHAQCRVAFLICAFNRRPVDLVGTRHPNLRRRRMAMKSIEIGQAEHLRGPLRLKVREPIIRSDNGDAIVSRRLGFGERLLVLIGVPVIFRLKCGGAEEWHSAPKTGAGSSNE